MRSPKTKGAVIARDGRRFCLARAARKLALAVAAGLLAGRAASAQVDGTWLGTSDSTSRVWSNVALWSSNPLYPDAGGVATFGPDAGGSITLDRAVNLSQLRIDGPATNLLALTGTGTNRVTFVGAASLYAGALAVNSGVFVGPTLRFPLASGAGLVKAGPGTLNVNFADPGAAAQPLQGDVRIDGGALLITRAANALGGAGNRVILNGGSFGLSGDVGDWTVHHPITVNAGGGGLSNLGSGAMTVAGPVSGVGALRINYDDSQFSGSPVVFTAVNPLAGRVVQEAKQSLVLTGAGAFTAIPSLTVNGGRVELDYADGAADRLADAAAMDLASGAWLNLSAPGAAAPGPVEERVGALRLVGGEVVVGFTTSSTSKAVTLRAASLDRAGRGILRIGNSVGLGGTAGGRVVFDVAPAMIGAGPSGSSTAGIVPGVIATDPFPTNIGLVTYTAATGLRRLTDAEYDGGLSTTGGPRNARLTTNVTPTGPRTVNSLTLAAGPTGTGTYGGGHTLTVNSGVIVNNYGWSLNVPVNFAGREAILYTDTGNLWLTGSLSNADGLTVSGQHGRWVVLSGANSTFTGPVTVNGPSGLTAALHVVGSVRRNMPGPLGNSDAPVVLAGAGAELHFDTPNATFGRDLRVDSGPGPALLHAGGLRGTSLVMTGNVSGAGTFAAAGVDFQGTLSGDLALAVDEDVVRLRSAANSFTGGTRVSSTGVLALHANGVLGTGPLRIEGGSTREAAGILADTVPLRITNDVAIVNGANFSGTKAVELAGRVGISNIGSLTATVDNAVPLTLSGVVRIGSMTKKGAGTMVVSAAPRRMGRLEVWGGTLEFGGGGPVSTTSLSMPYSGVLRMAPGGRNTFQTTAFGPGGTSAVDLTDNALVAASTPYSVLGYVKSGYRDGGWDGPGVRSSIAAANPGRYGVGYAYAGNVLDFSYGATREFLGVTVSASHVLYRTTLLGDTTLDGVVNFTDLLSLARNYNGTSRAWYQGDFNYDGTVNFTDLLSLAKNYNQALPVGPIAGAPAGFGAELAAAFAQAVPEPSAGLLAAACGVTLGRRRRGRLS